MLPSLLVAAAVVAPGAPVPRDTDPNPSGPAPRVVAVRADGTGVVWITAQVYEKRKVQQQFFEIVNGQQVLKQQEVEQTVSNYIRKPIGDFGGKFSTADGTPLTTEEATKRVKDGATLLVTADGKPIGKGWLRTVDDDTVIMVAEGLAQAHFQYGSVAMPTTPAPRLAKFCVDDSGIVRVAVNSSSDSMNNGQVYADDLALGNARVIRVKAVQFDSAYAGSPQGSVGVNTKALADVKFDAYDAKGKLIPRIEALNRLKAGGMVLVAGDNRLPDPDYLKSFREDVIVIVSGELIFPIGMQNPYDMAPKSSTAPAKADKQDGPVKVIARPVQQLGVGAQVKIAPAVIKAAALPAPVPAVEKPVVKPQEKP